jgi:hypothetical protein
MVTSLPFPICYGSTIRGDSTGGVTSLRTGGVGGKMAGLFDGAAAVIDSSSSSGASLVMCRRWNVKVGSVEVRFSFLDDHPLIVWVTRSVIG